MAQRWRGGTGHCPSAHHTSRMVTTEINRSSSPSHISPSRAKCASPSLVGNGNTVHHLRAPAGCMTNLSPLSARDQGYAVLCNAVGTAGPMVSGTEDTVVDLNSLAEYILSGPLLQACGISSTDVLSNLDEWVRLGKQLADQLGFHDTLDDIQRMRIYQYYLPVYFWCHQQLLAHKATGSQQALVIGISAPQGCGKTTLVEQLQALFTANGNTAVSVSIDDFYLTYKDQSALAAANPDNRLLQYRGNAGTHDLTLGTHTLQAMRNLRHPDQTAGVPRYDKSAYAGRGDRAPPESWPQVKGPVEVVLFEGWMSGFAPLPEDSQAEAVSPGLAAVNAALRGYKDAWDALVDSWLVIRIADPQWVFKWRLQAEEKMRAGGKPGMTDEQVADFVARFQPAYQAYLPGLYSKGPTTARHDHTLVIEVDQNRAPLKTQPAPPV